MILRNAALTCSDTKRTRVLNNPPTVSKLSRSEQAYVEFGLPALTTPGLPPAPMRGQDPGQHRQPHVDLATAGWPPSGRELTAARLTRISL